MVWTAGRRSGDWIVEQAVHNWDVLNWAVNALPVRAMAMGRNDLFRDRQPDRDVHDGYTGVVEYPGNVFVNIIHSWVSPTKFNEEYTRLIGTKGGGRLQFRHVLVPASTRSSPTRNSAAPETNNTLLALHGPRQLGGTRSEPGSHVVERGRAAVLTHAFWSVRRSMPGRLSRWIRFRSRIE